MSINTVSLIRERVNKEFSPVLIDLIDDTAAHEGHRASGGGAGHFKLKLVSARFNGVSVLNRHRMVYAALADLMDTRIHALSMELIASDEGA